MTPKVENKRQQNNQRYHVYSNKHQGHNPLKQNGLSHPYQGNWSISNLRVGCWVFGVFFFFFIFIHILTENSVSLQ